MEHIIHSIFSTPVYIAKRDNLDSIEEKDIEDIFKSMRTNAFGGDGTKQLFQSVNTRIFDTKLYKLKEFCEEHIKIYVEEIISPIEEVDFYITQSWLNIVKPGGEIYQHWHSNSIISGVFYISTEEDDKIVFSDERIKVFPLEFQIKEFNLWNSLSWFIPSINNELILFPSWLNHRVDVNKKATKNRISLSFNVFIRGTLGKEVDLNQLIL